MDIFQSSDWKGLWENIVTNRQDDTVRLVAADWLEDNGEVEFAAFIRDQIFAATLSPRPLIQFQDFQLTVTTTELVRFAGSGLLDVDHRHVRSHKVDFVYHYKGELVYVYGLDVTHWDSQYEYAFVEAEGLLRPGEGPTKDSLVYRGLLKRFAQFSFPWGQIQPYSTSKLKSPLLFWRGFPGRISCEHQDWKSYWSKLPLPITHVCLDLRNRWAVDANEFSEELIREYPDISFEFSAVRPPLFRVGDFQPRENCRYRVGPPSIKIVE